MPQELQEVKSYIFECATCAAEVIVTVKWSPGFKDIALECPFCHRGVKG